MRLLALLSLLLLASLPASASNGSWDCKDTFCSITFDTAGALPARGPLGCSAAVTTTGTAYQVDAYRDSGLTRTWRLPNEAGAYGDVQLTQTNYYADATTAPMLYFNVVSGSGVLRVDYGKCR